MKPIAWLRRGAFNGGQPPLPARLPRASGREENAVSEGNAPHTAPLEGSGTRNLTWTVIVLAILPLVLPWPFLGLAAVWIFPGVEPRLSQCSAAYLCQSAADWNRLGWLLVLGPSLLVALASIFLGTIGLVRARRHPTSPKTINLLQGSVVSGVAWACLLGCVGWVFFYLAAIFD